MAAVQDELRALSVRLADAPKMWRTEVQALLRAEMDAAEKAVRAAARSEGPQAGGLAALVAGQPIKITATLGTTVQNVRMKQTSRGAYNMNQGYVNHPVFGDREVWARTNTQQAAGWWSSTLEGELPAITAAMAEILREINDAMTLSGV